MTRERKILFGCALAFVFALIMFIGVYYANSDLRERTAILQPLLATNAPLTNVVAIAGGFRVTRKNTPEWTRMLTDYRTGPEWDQHIADKMKRAAAIGHTSTEWVQTWIFLDEHDRLIDFEVGIP